MKKNTIWHDMKERPTDNKESVIILYKNGCAWLWCYDLQNDAFYDCQEGYYRLNEDDAEKWCYIDDLIAQADKAERLQKAVDLAILRLEQGKKKFGKSTMGPNKETAMLCEIVIDEIKKLIKG